MRWNNIVEKLLNNHAKCYFGETEEKPKAFTLPLILLSIFVMSAIAVSATLNRATITIRRVSGS